MPGIPPPEENKTPAPSTPANPLLLSKREREKLSQERKGRVAFIRIFDSDGNERHLAFAYPTEPQFQRFMSELSMDSSGDAMFRAGKTLLSDTLLHPGHNEFNELIQGMPALVAQLTGELQKKISSRVVEEIKN